MGLRSKFLTFFAVTATLAGPAQPQAPSAPDSLPQDTPVELAVDTGADNIIKSLDENFTDIRGGIKTIEGTRGDTLTVNIEGRLFKGTKFETETGLSAHFKGLDSNRNNQLDGHEIIEGYMSNGGGNFSNLSRSGSKFVIESTRLEDIMSMPESDSNEPQPVPTTVKEAKTFTEAVKTMHVMTFKA